MQTNLVELAAALSEAANSIFIPGAQLVIDESVYAFEGKCPVKRFIPRKPHPNGLLSYGLAGEMLVGYNKLPIVYDYEPVTLDNTPSAQVAMMKLLDRFKQKHGDFHPHIVVDSAFGSFDLINNIINKGRYLLF